VAALTEELQTLRLAYKKLRQSRTDLHPDEAQLDAELEAETDPLASLVDAWDESLDEIVCFDMT